MLAQGQNPLDIRIKDDLHRLVSFVNPAQDLQTCRAYKCKNRFSLQEYTDAKVTRIFGPSARYLRLK